MPAGRDGQPYGEARPSREGPNDAIPRMGSGERRMSLPALIVTGASGFVGRHLLDELKDEYRIFGIARRSQRECGAPVHPNIAWMQVDV